jgi:hypothetical protein
MRSNRTAAVYYDDILTAITRLETYCAERTLDEFLGDVQLQDSVLYRLLALTEAAHRLQPEEECSARDKIGARFATWEMFSVTITTASISPESGMSFKTICPLSSKRLK